MIFACVFRQIRDVLVSFTGDARKMGPFVAPVWMRTLAWTVAVIIAALNVWLLVQTFAG